MQREGGRSGAGVREGPACASASTPGRLSAAQCHPGARGDVQPGVCGASGPLCQPSWCLRPQQVWGVGWREGPGQPEGHTGRVQGLTSTRVPRATCLLSRFPKPAQPILLRDCRVLPLAPGLPLAQSQELIPGAPPSGPQPRPPTAVDPDVEPTLLRHPQVRARARRDGVADGDGIPGRQPCPGPHPCICSPEPLLPCRVPWSSALTCPPWAATPSCCTASSPTTPPSLWRSSSAGAESGKVSGRGGPGGRPPRREAHQGSSDTAPLCGGRHRRGQIRPLLVLKRGAQGPAHTAAPASRPPARLCS